jgi:phytoene dehydrogenase-like protein
MTEYRRFFCNPCNRSISNSSYARCCIGILRGLAGRRCAANFCISLIHTHCSFTTISIDSATGHRCATDNVHHKKDCVEHAQNHKNKNEHFCDKRMFHGRKYNGVHEAFQELCARVRSMQSLLVAPTMARTPARDRYDAVVVGSGPNGLAAAITLAQAGKSVLVLEANNLPGGGARSMELTLPGFTHDLCSAIHPLGIASPFFRALPLHDFGLTWIHAPHPLAHVLDDGRAVIVERDLDAMCVSLGEDGPVYRRLMMPFLPYLNTIFDQTLGPLKAPHHPLLLSRLGLTLLQSADTLRKRFRTQEVQALLGGLAAHSVLPLEKRFSAGIAVMLGLTLHDKGWPLPRGGSQQITWALIRYLQSLGGEIVTHSRVTSLKELPTSQTVLFDTSPRTLSAVAGDRLSDRYKSQLAHVRYGPSVFKLDWALDAPIPWKNAGCKISSTIHIGGTFEEVAMSERHAWEGRIAEKPFMILTQPSLFDDTRAPAGKHTAWAYCHVPHGSTIDMTERMENQIERFAPGFKKIILKRSVMHPADIEAHNANNIGGDITGGVMDLRQLFKRPTSIRHPYNTPDPTIFLCSSSTPPGGGVHGMCGAHAARAALKVMEE